ncbi:GNAT family N-acetyltransferase [Rhodobacteraceae bacterium B1Z28]|uniref:GNAT family N-acetyltransferase n=1 Tax=Ruegeria haliotis TaxID=2747601 RepID=A0ABX2PLP8_9RHOB|nr:GNAT family N-acetyltransferase [Ruegeria haliotis]NVO55035.1 GNAT family N-acetyltransferase [Ruegeria haliotis]
MPKIQFRPAIAEDVESIQECIAQAYADARRQIEDLPDVTAGLADDIDAHHVILAETGNETVGVIVFDRVGDAMMVFNLAVVPQSQGQGLARKLLRFVEDKAVALQCARLRLRTHRLMHGTITMYQHLGWRVTVSKGSGLTMEKDVILAKK